mgnify:CR=1 FL=1
MKHLERVLGITLAAVVLTGCGARENQGTEIRLNPDKPVSLTIWHYYNGAQQATFNALVEETLGDDCAYDTVLEIHEKLNDLIESQKDEPEPVVLTKSEVKRLFEECGVEDEKLQNFDEQYELAAGEKSSLVASNITNTRKFEIKTPDVVIHVAPDRAELVETRIIDGRKCLVIPMESEIELNGIRVSTLNSVEDTSAEPLPVNDITDIDNSNTEEEIPF